ncbi:MAG: SpoIIIAC/SpoIIIAD family protein [bacterium]
MAIQWIGLCVAAALICAMLRPQRPELAMGISLAVGAAALTMLALKVRAALPELKGLTALFQTMDGDAVTAMLRAAGITILAELGGQLCRDAGETALAGRIGLIARVAILALCVPVASRLVEWLLRLAP